MMQESVNNTFEPTSVSRRALAKGAAWTLPAIAVAAAAPVYAASLLPGLQGWVEVGKNCYTGDDTLTIKGTGGNGATPPDSGTRGLWVYNTTSTTTLTNARITFYYPDITGGITWVAASGNAGWSVPVTPGSGLDPVIAGYTAYTTYYAGTWTFHAAAGAAPSYSTADGRPNFTGTAALNNSQCNNNGLQIYAQRTVTVNGTIITFQRGPVSL